MNFSDNIDKLAPALLAAQMACEGAKKASENPAFKKDGKAMKYAGLPEVVEACFPACHANGIFVSQQLGETVDGKMGICTLLLHSSGQWLKSCGSIPLQKLDPQGFGSASTYARRYHLAAVMGIIQEDDDGNEGSKAPPKPKEAKVEPKADPVPCISEDQRVELVGMFDSLGVNIKDFEERVGINGLPKLAATRFNDARALIITMSKEKEND